MFDHKFSENIAVHQSLRYQDFHNSWDNWLFITGMSADRRTVTRAFYGPYDQHGKYFRVDTNASARFDTGALNHYLLLGVVKGRPIASISGRETWDLRKTLSKPAVKARIEYDIGAAALHPGSIGPMWRAIIQRAFDCGALGDLTADDLSRLLKGISAHSTRVGLNQDLFVAGEDLAGIMDALRWKSPRMPLAYNRNLAAEAGAVGRLARKLE